MSGSNTREFDIVIWGATGFTGSLVAEYFATRYADLSVVRWAIAGRSRDKLEAVKASLVKIDEACKNVQILIGDSNDQQSVDNVVHRTRVIISTAGPFAKYGTPVVDACVRLGTHYCDITGETPWIRNIINKYDADARRNGVMIVPSCGFDSIPSDIGAFMVVDYCKSKLQRNCSRVRGYLWGMKGGASGGTIASAMNMFEDKSLRGGMRNPYLLNPKESKLTTRHKESLGFGYDNDIQSWTAPFIMASANSRIVRRSADLAHDSGYSDAFSYDECTRCRNIIIALLTLTTLTVMLFVMLFSFTRKLASYVLPKPGEGPTKEQRDNGYFELRFVGFTEESPKKVMSIVRGNRDPGYAETAKMLAESALCLALHTEQLPGKSAIGGGILTPASCMGNHLVDRLRKAGMVLEVTQA